MIQEIKNNAKTHTAPSVRQDSHNPYKERKEILERHLIQESTQRTRDVFSPYNTVNS